MLFNGDSSRLDSGPISTCESCLGRPRTASMRPLTIQAHTPHSNRTSWSAGTLENIPIAVVLDVLAKGAKITSNSRRSFPCERPAYSIFKTVLCFPPWEPRHQFEMQVTRKVYVDCVGRQDMTCILSLPNEKHLHIVLAPCFWLDSHVFVLWCRPNCFSKSSFSSEYETYLRISNCLIDPAYLAF